MNTYTLIAYKPNSDDYCRGCHMASYSSNFEIHPNISRDDVIKIASMKFNYPHECGETGYTIHIQKSVNGVIATWEIGTKNSFGMINMGNVELSDEDERDFNDIENLIKYETT